MPEAVQQLPDHDARAKALTLHDRSLLVEAGAGSGKTAILAGRIVLMMAAGVAPRSIAAVTFTELAASQLLARIRSFADSLLSGDVPTELRAALPNGLSRDQSVHLETAKGTIDQITCSTIHGFCQRLIKPYPVEADIDPGASVMDRDQADLAFLEIGDEWLREELESGTSELLAELVLVDPQSALDLVRLIANNLRRYRDLQTEEPPNLARLVSAFIQKCHSFVAFVQEAEAREPETQECAECFSGMAEAVSSEIDPASAQELVRLLVMRPAPSLCTQAGAFKKFQKKGKWQNAAKAAGLSKTDGDRLFVAAERHYEGACDAWQALHEAVAAHLLSQLVDILRPIVQRFRNYKRSTALLDFDDLLFSARDLLRDHSSVREALAERYRHVLVDEFQDTDPLQIEIFWRLCGDPGADATEWTSFRIRNGALFLVGDPKQAIYRFRGADVAAYLQAREAFLAQDADSVLSIATNFRSCEPILSYVNQRFSGPLSTASGQPGFIALDAFLPSRDEGLCVAALDVAVAGENGKASAQQQRDGEAEAVAELCARMIGSEFVIDHGSGTRRPCRPGDIALLAPTGSDLWRYEEALERRGVPVATQAGKGFFRRQEIQDLIAITRVLAEPRDTLAFGALLRGPLVGLTEEELLDVAWSLPRREDAPDALPRFQFWTPPEQITLPLARDIVEKLQALRRKAHATTPHQLLSEAFEVLRVRPILQQRHRGQAERALANGDLYLSLSRSFEVRGLRAFAETMSGAWSEEVRAVEGRPDAQEEAVALYTMHAAKGLEWPVVLPINSMTLATNRDIGIIDRSNGKFYCPVLGVEPTGYEGAKAAEHAELTRERVRLWYVAATRARELLILPRLDVQASEKAWVSLVDLGLNSLPALDLSRLPAEVASASAGEPNVQTRDVFAREAAEISRRQKRLRWSAPSREERSSMPTSGAEGAEIFVADTEGVPIFESSELMIRGGRDRGILLHKLVEEVLNGEAKETLDALEARANALINSLGLSVANTSAEGLVPAELAATALESLGLSAIADLRPRLLPECPVYSSALDSDTEEARAGIVDAIAWGEDGVPHAVVDWKSDVTPTQEAIDHYRHQVLTYLEMTGIERGIIVLMTTGQVIEVVRHNAS